MNFDLSPDQKLLASTVSAFVKKESPIARKRVMREDALGYSKEVWKQMAELGWLGLAFPESVGGFGGSFVDVAIVLEQFGTALVPEPFVPTLLAGMAIARAGTSEQHEALLGPTIAGEMTLALAWAERGGRYDAHWIETTAKREGDGYLLSGEKVFVDNGHAADWIVLSARTSGGPGEEEGISLFVLSRETPGLSVTPIKTTDGGRAAMLRLSGVRLPASALLGEAGKAGALLDELMDWGAAATCAEGLGVMQTALTMTADYLRTREQFGVKIGTFQALQHRAVEMFIKTELARSMSILASIRVTDADAEQRRAAISAAKVEIAGCGRFITQQAIQLHGGIGMTDEHDIGLYFKRMLVLAASFGDEEHHLQRFASLPGFSQ